MNTSQDPQNNKPIFIWLILVCTLIFCMVVLGGVTRLTNSGLSMVNWKPIVGWLPPLNNTEWQTEFTHYQQSPEFQKRNFHMDVEQFKSIYYFEYAHRLLGRTIGLAFLLPFLYFLIRKKIQRTLIPKMLIMFVLGGLQGVLGWYMVKSGLVNNPHVSQYRLTAHLTAAIAIYSYILWVALGLVWTKGRCQAEIHLEPLRKFGIGVTTLILIMIISGGFVAGTKAGLAFNTFPLMNGQFIPDGLFSMTPFYLNFFENLLTVQFDHRMIAYGLFIIIPVFWLRIQKSPAQPRTKKIAHLFILMLGIQISLGISTLLFHVPVALGVTHQGGALVLLTLALMMNHELRKVRK
ncbi:MAG: heme A synthase [Gammaproteobacteria bacterium]|nr:heme A synthase [Gammaproteobacteria bacterium]